MMSGQMKVFRQLSSGVVGVFLLACLGAGAARAQTAKDQARAQWEQGSVEYTLGHYAEAARRYEQAYRFVQDPALLFNLAQADRMAGQIDQAILAYRSYLRASPPGAADRELAKKWVAQLEASRGPAGTRALALGAPTPPMPNTPGTLIGVEPSSPAAAPAAAPAGHRWWLWGLVGVAVVGGVTAILVATHGDADPVAGSAGTVTIR
jgi:hypothetical protein